MQRTPHASRDARVGVEHASAAPPPHPPMGARRFGRVNWIGLEALALREIRRFLTVFGQTLVGPLITAGLFVAIFTLAFGESRGPVLGAPFEHFLAPGVVMMTVIQNAFANTSSSLMIAKAQGSITDTLTPPLSASELVAGMCAGGVARGALIALLCVATLYPAVGLGPPHLLWLAAFAVTGSAMLSLLGLAAAIWAEKLEHLAAITNFIIMPLSFLSGTFYSIDVLPEFWRTLSHINPIFYLIDGFRYASIGASDSAPWLGFAVCLGATAALWALCWRMVAVGYKLKS